MTGSPQPFPLTRSFSQSQGWARDCGSLSRKWEQSGEAHLSIGLETNAKQAAKTSFVPRPFLPLGKRTITMRLKSSICWRNSLGSIEVKASTLDRAMGGIWRLFVSPTLGSFGNEDSDCWRGGSECFLEEKRTSHIGRFPVRLARLTGKWQSTYEGTLVSMTLDTGQD